MSLFYVCGNVSRTISFKTIFTCRDSVWQTFCVSKFPSGAFSPVFTKLRHQLRLSSWPFFSHVNSCNSSSHFPFITSCRTTWYWWREIKKERRRRRFRRVYTRKREGAGWVIWCEQTKCFLSETESRWFANTPPLHLSVISLPPSSLCLSLALSTQPVQGSNAEPLFHLAILYKRYTNMERWGVGGWGGGA